MTDANDAAALPGGFRATAPLAQLFNGSADNDEIQANTACRSCRSPRITGSGTVRSYPYSRCRSCGFTFANPTPYAASAAFYNSDFYANYRVLESERAVSDRYFSISAYTPAAELTQWLGADTGARVLDFGCGPGAFLAHLREQRGFTDVTGLEVNQDAVTVAKERYDLDLLTDTAQLHPDGYDAVTLLEVIEHLPDPDAVLAEIAALIRPGGRILISTPSTDNLAARLTPQHCVDFTPPSHISLFNQQSLEDLLARHGFHTVRVRHDRSWEPLWNLAVAALYRLDFLSPRHRDDVDDRYYTPTRPGRALGLRPGRPDDLRPARLLRLLKRIDRLGARLAIRLPLPTHNHLYLLAQSD